MSRVQRRHVGVAERRVAAEPAPDPCLHGFEFPAEHPQEQAERPEILAAAPLRLAQTERFHGLEVEVVDVGRDDLELVERAILARVVLIPGFREAPRREAVVVEDDQRAGLQHRQAHLERSGIEGHEDVRCIARGRDRLATEIDLVSRHAEGRAGRRPDLRRVVREGREVPSGERRRDRELRAHELYAVAGVAGEPHDDRL
jgi:hypothetical protein